MDSGFIAECQAFVDSFSDGNVLLTIELTEREPFDGSHEMLERLRSLHTCGFTLALDDSELAMLIWNTCIRFL
ncbi:Uncharacterised protein [Salmonella enterica subsp. arizonae]|uniref:Anti-FlhC(2)FlhD(4) factor YdiV n=1 Tax=Salmonella enterica subsp. arizonae TaxID=59203 RepID=A0A379SEC3_SALER|nr:Uncharacterised protein [Salmonella enterica subsp. arizonae]